MALRSLRQSTSSSRSRRRGSISRATGIARNTIAALLRNNLTRRMQSRRMTRLTNGFSKAAEFHLYATALHMTWYNYIRTHTTLSKKAGKPTTPAMASGLAAKPWAFTDLLNLLHGE
jgi:hypothetical protein